MTAPRFRPRVAVVGAGIAGLSAAWLLRHAARPVLFEAEPRLGGHADTQVVTLGGCRVDVDTGFIVFNERTYPRLTALFAALGVATQPSDMSFAVSIGRGALEYASGDLGRLFAQRRNALRPRFWGMLADILRFHRAAPALLAGDGGGSLGEYLDRNGYGRGFAEWHLLPMGAAIWSGSVAGMREFPARPFVRFLHENGLLSRRGRPAWRSVTGGAQSYVARLAADLPDIRPGRRVRGVARAGGGVTLHLDDGSSEGFDRAILACHPDQALVLLAAPSPAERAVLGALRCQENLAVLHSDRSMMPRRRGAWSAWNYLSDGDDRHRPASITYWMNRLQALSTPEPLLVTLNPQRDPGHVLRTRRYRHPIFDAGALQAQARLPDIQGKGGLWFAGAWTGWGFHEDGIASGSRIATALGAAVPWCSLSPAACPTPPGHVGRTIS